MRIVCDIQQVVEHSFKNLHVPGFNYLCLHRDPSNRTIKLYTFEGEAAHRGAELVIPHDHRYDFSTWVLGGEMKNVWYLPDARGDDYTRLNWRTPLNGGNGWEESGRTRLRPYRAQLYNRFNGPCEMLAEEIHTIQVTSQTVLLLEQRPDRVVEHTASYLPAGERQPSLEGCYERFTEGEVFDWLLGMQDELGWGICHGKDGQLFIGTNGSQELAGW